MLIEKGNFQILIDGGPDDSILEQLGRHLPLMDRKIELVVLTHPHADHLTGLNLVLERYEVERIVSNDIQYDSSNTYKKFVSYKEDLIKNKRTESIVPKPGQSIPLFDGANIEFYWPAEQISLDNVNNTSIVSKFCYIEKCVFLPGDLEVDAMQQLIDLAEKNNKNITAEIIKLSHHGSSNGTNQSLLDAIKPRMAVISVAQKNKFNHPHDSVLKLLELNNLQVFKTWDGSQVFLFDAQGVVRVK